MLPRHFNHKVYEEFRQLALQDAAGVIPARAGLDYLQQFYQRIFVPDSDAPKPWPQGRAIPEIFSLHYQEVASLQGHHHIGIRAAATV
jgi:la-related protein 1